MIRHAVSCLTALVIGLVPLAAIAAEETITIHTTRVIKTVEPFLSGACLEDVNHEVYGGIYSQMIFGESFQEPAKLPPLDGFTSLGGEWSVRDGVLTIDGTDGPKLLSQVPAFSDGSVSVDIKFDRRDGDNAGLIVRASDAKLGADAFEGYEISLDVGRQIVRLARHRNNYDLLHDAPCEIPLDEWVALKVSLAGSAIEVHVNGKAILQFDDRAVSVGRGQVGLRVWNKVANFRNLCMNVGGTESPLPFRRHPAKYAVSRTWEPAVSGSALAEFEMTTDRPFKGRQAQVMRFTSGEGTVGLVNRSLNGWGMNFIAGRPYDGYVWVRAEQATQVVAALESHDGEIYAEQTLDVPAGGWHRADFALTPTTADSNGQFALRLKRPGKLTLGHAFLQPGPWGRYKNLPVRQDVVEALLSQGITALRYGGSMVNHAEYRWKNMTGPSDRRPMTAGNWYRYSSNGWAVPDFLNLCEAMGVVGIPDLNVNETPADIADFVEYANGSASTKGGAQRVADGHSQPYDLRHLQLGNEESVNDAYADKFISLADAAWKVDPKLILVVGDFAYHRPFTDPDRLPENAGRIANMNAHRRILAFAKERGGEVWFDVHTWSERKEVADDLAALPTYVNAIEKIANDARHRVVVFELNAFSHHLGRGLANARSVNHIRRDGRLPIVIAANCLQPDGQNDNGWNQGLVFLIPSKVWLQPAAYVTQMQAKSRQPVLVKSDEPKSSELDITASQSKDGKILIVEIVNFGEGKDVELSFEGFSPTGPTAERVELSGPWAAANTAAEPNRVVPRTSQWTHGFRDGKAGITVPAHSFTVLRFE